MFDNTRINT